MLGAVDVDNSTIGMVRYNKNNIYNITLYTYYT